jgi:hypothetical protein
MRVPNFRFKILVVSTGELVTGLVAPEDDDLADEYRTKCAIIRNTKLIGTDSFTVLRLTSCVEPEES